MKKNDLVIVIIFIVFLFIPNIAYWFIKDKMDNNNYENRNLYTKPEFSFKNITEFPKNYENYYNDNLSFKNEIRKIRANVNYKFGISSSERVIVGKNGWLFYNSIAAESVSSISDYRKTTKYKLEEKEKIKDSLLNTRDNLKENDIEFYILVAPNKENVYSDYLESKIGRSNAKFSRIEDLVNYLRKNTDLELIYPKDVLVNNRKIENTYYKYDTHWNYYGGYLGTIELMKNIDSEFEIPKIRLEKMEYAGDLANMNLTSKLTNKEPIVKGFYDDIKFSCEEKPEFKYCNSNDPIYDKTILFVGDSFRNATIQYLAKLYKNSIFVHRDYFDKKIINDYNIDIVVYEVVERYSDSLYNTEIIFNK